jgi:hypothetical protein
MLTELLSRNGLAVGAIIVFAVIVVSSILSTTFSIEIQTNKAVNKINSYLEKKPFVNDENLVEFNRLMKAIPKPMRYQWQQYMLNRDKAPSEFITQSNCIERPFRSSAYEQTVIYTKNIISIIALIFLVISFSQARGLVDTGGATIPGIADMLYETLITPALFYVLGILLLIFLRARRKAVVSDLYYNFDYLTSGLDKAVETIPDVVDYEILFSKKEIKQGIPALQDYLDQRAIYEQEQLERAKAGIVEHDKYNFAGLGLNGSLVMERAMREAEYYLGNRRRLLLEIEQFEGEKDSQTRAYTESSKTLQRKLRDVKESLERLRESLANATSKIDSNYVRKQQLEEVKKQQSLEKEMNTLTNRFNKDVVAVEDEIAKRVKEVTDQRGYLEKAMAGEFKEFSKKAFDQLDVVVEKKNKDTINKLRAEKNELEQELDTSNIVMVEKEVLFKEKLEAYSEQEEVLRKKDEEIALKEEFIKGQEARIKELAKGKVIQRYFDANGNEFFYDEDSKPYYKDASGNIVYYDSELEEEEAKEEKLIKEEIAKLEEKAKKEEKPVKKTVAKKTVTKKPAKKADDKD